jgi:hypothetical protein
VTLGAASILWFKNMVSGVVLLAFGGIVGILVCCFKNTIDFLCGILAASAEFIKKHTSVVFLPIIFGLLSLVVSLVWVFVYLKIYFYGTVERNTVYGREH